MPSSDYVVNVKATGTENAAHGVEQLHKRLGQMGEAGALVSKGIASLQAALSIGAIVEFTMRTIKSAQAMEELSRTSRTSLEFLSQLKSGAKKASTEFEPLLQAYQAFAKAQGDLNAGIGRSGPRKKAFELLGFSDKDLETKTADQNIAALTKRMQDGRLTAEQYAAGLRLMGDSFRNLAAASSKGLGSSLGGEAPNVSSTRFLANVGDNLAKASNVGGGIARKLLARVIAIKRAESGYYLKAFGQTKAGDEMIEESRSVFAGTYGQNDEAKKTAEDDARSQLESRKAISNLEKQLRRTLGHDADDLLEDLSDQGATKETYEKVLRRARRAKRKQLEELGGQTSSVSALGSDSLQRIGGFAGGMRALGLQQTVVRLNERMVDHLLAIRNAVTSPDPV